MFEVKLIINWNSQGKNKISDKNTAKIFGINVRVNSWMEVTAWNIETANPVTKPNPSIGAESIKVVFMLVITIWSGNFIGNYSFFGNFSWVLKITGYYLILPIVFILVLIVISGCNNEGSNAVNIPVNSTIKVFSAEYSDQKDDLLFFWTPPIGPKNSNPTFSYSA